MSIGWEGVSGLKMPVGRAQFCLGLEMGLEEVGVSLKCEMSFKQCLCVFCVIEIDLVMKTTMDVFVRYVYVCWYDF